MDFNGVNGVEHDYHHVLWFFRSGWVGRKK